MLDRGDAEGFGELCQISSRVGFARALTALREGAGKTVRDVAKITGMSASTLGGYFAGAHLPPLRPDVLPLVVRACGVRDDAIIELWMAALRRVRRSPGRRPAAAPVPYRGLAGFQPEDADFFCGREDLTRQLVDRVIGLATGATTGPLLVVGPSGAGKSSLLRAGLIPALRDAGRWCCRLLTPGAHPVAALAAALGLTGQSVEDLVKHGQPDEGAAPPGHAGAGDSERRLVLVVDQFEEVFTACADHRERRAFIAALCAASGLPAEEPPGRPGAPPALVVLGLRADFYAHLLGHPRLARVAQDAQVVVGPMTEAELRRAIEEPARRAKVDIQQELVELLLRDLVPSWHSGGGAPEAGALPLLSHALLATWLRGRRRRLTVADYLDIGGLHGAVAQSAEDVYAGLTDRQRELARRLFLRLIQVAEDAADTRRRVRLAELMDGAGLEAGEFADLLDRFVEHRLMTVDARSVQISHEALIPAWPRLRAWVDSDRAALVLDQQIMDAARRWEREHRDTASLYRGAPLAAARARLARHGQDALSTLAAEFLDASSRQERLRRQRSVQIVAGLAAMLLVAVTTGLFAIQQRAEARDQRVDNDRERRAAISRLVATRADGLRDTDVSLAAQLGLAAYQIAQTPEARASLLDSSATAAATRLLGGPGPLLSLAIAAGPDQQRLATVGADGRLRLWDISVPGRPAALARERAGPEGTISTVAFSPNGRTLAVGGSDGTVQLWDVTDQGEPEPLDSALAGPEGWVYALAFSPDGRTLVASSADRLLHRWDVGDPAHPATVSPPLTAGAGFVQSLAFSPDGRALAAGGDDQTVQLWDMRESAKPAHLGRPLTGPEGRVYSVAFSPDGTRLAAGSAAGRVSLWDTTTPEQPKVLAALATGSAGWVNGLAFSPDGRLLAVASSDGLARVWDIAGERFAETLPHPGPVTAVAFGRTAAILATTAADGVARLWALPGPRLTGHGAAVTAVTFDQDGRFLASASADTQLWNVAERRRLAAASSNQGAFSAAVAFRPGDDGIIAIGDRGGTVTLWDTDDPARPVRLGGPFRAHTNVVTSLVFTPDGTVLITGGDDYTARLWDVAEPARPTSLSTVGSFDSFVSSVAVSRDGRMLAAGSLDSSTRLWDITDPRRPSQFGEPLTGSDQPVLSVAFNPDGRTLAAGSADGTVRRYDLAEPSRPRLLGTPLRGPTSYVSSLSFSRDGRTLAASIDKTVALWDVGERDHPVSLGTLTVPTGQVYSVAFHPIEQTLAAGGADQVVWLWEIDPRRAAGRICATAGAPITASEWRQYMPDLPYRDPCRA